jgi:DNA repair photolyase
MKMKNIKTLKTFEILNSSSKFAICGLPLRVDTYSYCTFQCKYCFAHNRFIPQYVRKRGEEEKVENIRSIRTPNFKAFDNQLSRIYGKSKYNPKSLTDVLVKDKITWHCGGMSDPFSEYEKKYHYTKKMIEIANAYDVHILFSTKSNTYYDCPVTPKNHTFQLSITNTKEHAEFEPGAPTLSSRIRFFNDLKNKGFKVGIRIQPFIPGESSKEIVKIFKDADYVTIEGLKLMQTPADFKQNIVKLFNLNFDMFKYQGGSYELKPSLKLELYKSTIELLEDLNIPHSIADNDLHYLSSGYCCCGDPLIHKSTTFNSTYFLKKFGKEYTIDNVKESIPMEYSECSTVAISPMRFGALDDKIKKDDIFKRRYSSIYDQFKINFDKKSSTFSPKYQYYPETETKGKFF